MITSAFVITQKGRFKLNNNQIDSGKFIINLPEINTNEENSFDIEFIFDNPITQFRNHDYTWVDCKTDRIATSFSPKIIKLSNGTLVQANINLGIWEVNKNKSKVLLWRFNTVNAHPIVNYSGKKNEKVIVQANNKIVFDTKPALLFSTKNAIEFSRSQIPFSAITCFTDHCDFDTLENLKTQRIFFKNNGIKVTKGFFLNHFSKREDNASFENDSNEINEWRNDGHELAYHSLSQSIKSDEESFSDFENFTPPFPDIPTWIDHGYQPYNLSLYKKIKIDDDKFASNLTNKNISTLWNYIDSGTTTNNVINQLNPYDFTLNNFNKGNRKLKLINRISLLIKNIFFHFYDDEKLIIKYKLTANSFKKVLFQREFKSIPTLIISFYDIAIPLLKVVFSWNSVKNRPYKNAKYSPFLFKHTINNSTFTIFQTVEIIDFKKSLNPKNIEKLIHEKGVFIAHTYFSAPMKYHYGKMINSNQKIDETVAQNFENLSIKIKNEQIWNPTLNQLVDYLAKFDKIILDVDANQNISIVEGFNYINRNVQ